MSAPHHSCRVGSHVAAHDTLRRDDLDAVGAPVECPIAHTYGAQRVQVRTIAAQRGAGKLIQRSREEHAGWRDWRGRLQQWRLALCNPLTQRADTGGAPLTT